MRTVKRRVVAPPGLGTDFIGVPSGTDLELDLRLEAVMEGVLVSGGVRGRLAGQCVRCLDGVTDVIDVDLQELYVYPGRTPVDDETDDDLREIEDELIDLEPALRDAVVLALPFQPVCRPDCPGLCQECGEPLAGRSEHRHESVDPRWQALLGLVPDGGPPGPLHDEEKES